MTTTSELAATAARGTPADLATERLRRYVQRRARTLGASVVGFAPTARWDEYGEVPPAYRPEHIWPQARTVVVVGIPVLLPVLESTPSINYQEMYDTTNRLLDQIAYQLAAQLTDRGHASICLPRDGYAGLDVLLSNPFASFSHVMAAKYAGLGTIGLAHNLVTPEYGPRVRLVSIFTELEFPGGPVLPEDPCKGCDLCAQLCPVGAITRVPTSPIGALDKDACTRHHQTLVKDGCWPCGVCIKVCPIGADRKTYRARSIRRHLEERPALEKDPADPRYQGLVHLRRHGSRGGRIS